LTVTGTVQDGIVAQVRGSGGAVYRVEARVQTHRGAPRLVSACSYPVGEACKHVAAALIVAMERERAGGPPAAETASARLQPVLRNWLASLAQADRPTQPEQQDYPDTVRDRLLYVLDTGRDGRPAVTPYKATLKKDGSFRLGSRPYDGANLNAPTPPKFVLPVDRRILYRLDQQGLRRSANGFYHTGAPPPEPGAVMETLAWIAETGRGRLSAPRTGAFVWQAHECGAQRLVLTDAAGAGEGIRRPAGPARPGPRGGVRPDRHAAPGDLHLSAAPPRSPGTSWRSTRRRR
jgi:hypothetical protein